MQDFRSAISQSVGLLANDSADMAGKQKARFYCFALEVLSEEYHYANTNMLFCIHFDCYHKEQKSLVRQQEYVYYYLCLFLFSFLLFVFVFVLFSCEGWVLLLLLVVVVVVVVAAV